ncbi:MAG: GNAT family N-acetyltransferase [Burkholderiaceae bacterium]|nr:GNAT family N-acetyltransferase [Burkholderiaceae bacterium]
MAIIRTLQAEDADRLLQFECENRAWFEQTILPRPESVYSPAGIVTHIEECLDGLARGTFHPCILVEEVEGAENGGAIVGRANLKNIDAAASSTEIGYRIAERCTGKGLATAAVAHLMELAYGRWKLARILAYVTVENPASARVLERSGFDRIALIPNRSAMPHKLLDCYEYLHCASV